MVILPVSRWLRQGKTPEGKNTAGVLNPNVGAGQRRLPPVPSPICRASALRFFA
jgi:hypothetical protein